MCEMLMQCYHSRPTLWLLLFQGMGIGYAGPLWALFYHSSYSNVPSSLETLRHNALTLPRTPLLILPVLAVSYLFTAFVMSLHSPGILSPESKQFALVAWNIFPVTTLGLMMALSTLVPKEQSKKSDSLSELSRRHIKSVRWVYAIALAFSWYSHVAVSAVSMSTRLFPALFHSEYLIHLSPSALFVPPIAIERVETVGDGTRSFMLWDQVIGYSTVGLVMLVKLRCVLNTTGKSFNWFMAIAISLLASVVAGGGSTCLLICWLRDEALYGQWWLDKVRM